MHSAIEAVEGRPDKKWFEKFSLENAAKGNAIYQHLRGGGHEPAAQGAVSFGGGESVLLEFATLYLSPCSGFDADQAALFPFRRGRPDDPVLPAHEGRAFTSAQVCFKVTCNATNPGEGVFIVGSSPQLGDWDPAKGVACATTTETFPVWTSEPVSMHTAAEFKIVVQHAERRDGARWEGGGNKSVEGAALAGADSLTLSCSWGGLEVTATRA
ncbi:unnamed protein product [Prorocentrum cordatum]|uniref:CBM20 domain-containing protein n=1 Tax=Prorocentrum cordatum TaxID=2364126 RepID=A0ABN9PIP7_9DINO|nr:unnamed protein product [Polarella glacialis]